MIISRTPLRISFFSGGSDLPSFYTKENGAALSVTINKFIYVISHHTQHIGIKSMFDTVEQVSDIQEMQDGITKQTLSYFNIDKEITIASISDILSKGSGLGSSSAFTVGLINTFFSMDKAKLAELAFNIEANMCGHPVGKQDQYAASFGGMNLFEFYDTGYVKSISGPKGYEKLQDNLILVYSGVGRNANSILQKQKEASNDETKFQLIKAGRDKAYKGYSYLESGDFDSFGELLHEAWMDKKSVVKEISNEYFENIYNNTIKAGALGGKLLGAGGGGFFIFYAPDNKREEVINSINKEEKCRIYNFKFYNKGSEIILKC